MGGGFADHNRKQEGIQHPSVRAEREQAGQRLLFWYPRTHPTWSSLLKVIDWRRFPISRWLPGLWKDSLPPLYYLSFLESLKTANRMKFCLQLAGSEKCVVCVSIQRLHMLCFAKWLLRNRMEDVLAKSLWEDRSRGERKRDNAGMAKEERTSDGFAVRLMGQYFLWELPFIPSCSHLSRS